MAVNSSSVVRTVGPTILSRGRDGPAIGVGVVLALGWVGFLVCEFFARQLCGQTSWQISHPKILLVLWMAWVIGSGRVSARFSIVW